MATIGLLELKRGVNSNNYGFYSITVAKGTYTLKSSYLGYETQLITVLANDNKKIDVELLPKKIQK